MLHGLKARTPLLALILLVFGLGYTFAHTKVVVVPLGDAEAADIAPNSIVSFVGNNTNMPQYQVPAGKTLMITDVISTLASGGGNLRIGPTNVDSTSTILRIRQGSHSFRTGIPVSAGWWVYSEVVSAQFTISGYLF